MRCKRRHGRDTRADICKTGVGVSLLYTDYTERTDLRGFFRRGLVTVKVHDEPRNGLLPPKVDSRLVRPQFLPQDFLGGSRVTAQFLSALRFSSVTRCSVTIFLNSML